MMKKRWIIFGIITVLLLTGCYSIADALFFNNLKGIEKTLKDIYVFKNDEDGDYYVTPHDSDVVSVTVALDRSYTHFKMLLDIKLTNNRNLIVRDFNGKLKYMDIQKFGDYALEVYGFDPNEKKEDEKSWVSFLGVSLPTFNRISGFKFKKIKQIIDNYDQIYEYITNNLPEILFEKDKCTIYFADKTDIVEFDSTDDHATKMEKIFGIIDDSLVFTNKSGEKVILNKRKWTEKDEKINFQRISGER